MWDQGEGPSRLRSGPALGGLAQKLLRVGHSFPRAEMPAAKKSRRAHVHASCVRAAPAFHEPSALTRDDHPRRTAYISD